MNSEVGQTMAFLSFQEPFDYLIEKECLVTIDMDLDIRHCCLICIEWNQGNLFFSLAFFLRNEHSMAYDVLARGKNQLQEHAYK